MSNIKTQIEKLLKDDKSSALEIKQLVEKSFGEMSESNKRICQRQPKQKAEPQIFLRLRNNTVIGEIDYLPNAKPLEDEVAYLPQELYDWLQTNSFLTTRDQPLSPGKIRAAYTRYREIYPNTRICWFAWKDDQRSFPKGYPTEDEAAQDQDFPNICTPQEAMHILTQESPKQQGFLLKTTTIYDWKTQEKLYFYKDPIQNIICSTEIIDEDGFISKFSIPQRALHTFIHDVKTLRQIFYRSEANIIGEDPAHMTTLALLSIHFNDKVFQWKWWITNAKNKIEASNSAIEHVNLLQKGGRTRIALCLTQIQVENLLQDLKAIEL